MSSDDKTHTEKYNGRRYIRESPETIRARREACEKHMTEKKSYKNAWRLAFLEVPRVYIDEAPIIQNQSDEDLLSKGTVRTHEVDTETPSTSEDSG